MVFSNGGSEPHAYQRITDRIIQAIEAGAGEFVMPWHGDAIRNGRPVNALTRKPYTGGNAISLWAEGQLRGLTSSKWATYQQWQQLKSYVRRGEKGSGIVFYRPLTRGDDEDQEPGQFVARFSVVFNAEQVEGYQESLPLANTIDPPAELPHVESFVAAGGADIRHGGSMAAYNRVHDYIELPDRSAFVGSPTSSPTEAYYATVLHELVHWSGADRRLARQFGQRFKDELYAAEELVAELGAAFLCGDLGVANEPRPDHAAYVAPWLDILRADGRAIFTAARLAGQAAEYLHGLNLEAP